MAVGYGGVPFKNPKNTGKPGVSVGGKKKTQPTTNYGGVDQYGKGFPGVNKGANAPANYGPVDFSMGGLHAPVQAIPGLGGARGSVRGTGGRSSSKPAPTPHPVAVTYTPTPVQRATGGGAGPAPVATTTGPSGSGGGGSTIPSSKNRRAPFSSKNPAAPKTPDEITQMIRASLQQNNRLSDFYNTQNEAIRQATTADALKLSQAAGAESNPYVPNTTGLNAYSAGQVADQAGLQNNVNAAQTQGLAGLIAARGNAGQTLLGTMRDASNMQRGEYGRLLRQQEPKMRSDYAAAKASTALDMAKLQLAQQLGVGKIGIDAARINEMGRHNSVLENQGYARINQADRKLNSQAAKAARGSSDSPAEVKGMINDYLDMKVTTAQPVLDENGQPKVDPSGKPITSGSIRTNQPIPRTFSEIIGEANARGLSPSTGGNLALERGSADSFKYATAIDIFKAFAPLIGQRQAISLVSAKKGAKRAKFIRNNKRDILDNKFDTLNNAQTIANNAVGTIGTPHPLIAPTVA